MPYEFAADCAASARDQRIATNFIDLVDAFGVATIGYQPRLVTEFTGAKMAINRQHKSAWFRIVTLALLTLGGAAHASAATVATEYPDYAPGDRVVISGSGWEPGETVV